MRRALFALTALTFKRAQLGVVPVVGNLLIPIDPISGLSYKRTKPYANLQMLHRLYRDSGLTRQKATPAPAPEPRLDSGPFGNAKFQ